MNRKPSISRLCNLIILAGWVALVSIGAAAQKPEDLRLRTADLEQKAHQIYGGMPLLFEKNVGQASSQVSYLSHMPDYTLFLTEREAVILNNVGKKRVSALRMQWLNSNANPTISGEDKVAGKTNYLIGNNSSQWHTGVTNYTRVKYDAVYPGIDLVYYGNQQHIEYDLTVAPGADPQAIRLRFQGARRLRLDSKTGDLMVRSSTSEVRFRKPIVYQKNGDLQQTVSGTYVLSSRNTVSFALGDYDRTRPLVIDPYVVYSTMYGGSTSGTDENENYYGTAVDGQGFVYLQGIVNTVNLPTTSGSFQPACNLDAGAPQCSNFFVAKFDTTKSGAASLVYATYIGGSEVKVSIYNQNGSYYQMNDIAADSAGDAYFTGASSVANYPTTSNAYSQSCVAVSGQACYGAGVLTELDPTGSKLLYSTYLPASSDGFGVYPGGVAIDSSQIAYIVGGAGQGLPSTDGSTCLGCYQSPFVAAFDTTKTGAASLVYAEYLPFSGITAFAADSAGNAYVGGEYFPTTDTWTGTVQTIALNGFQTTTANTAGIGPYFVRLNHAGIATYSTYIGSGSTFGVTAIATDPNGIAYAGGKITGPVTQVNGLPSTSGYTGYDVFIAKIDTTKTGTASLLYSTFLAGEDNASEIFGLAANGTGQVAFSGVVPTGSSTFPEVNPLTQPAIANGYGPFVGILDTTQTGAGALTFLSLMDGVQFPESIAFDPSNNLIVGGYAVSGSASDPFISVPASYATSVSNVVDPPFFYKISLASPPSTINISPSALTFSNQVVNTTSASQAVTFQNSGTTAITFSSIVASSQFAETDNCSPSLAAGASCAINVTFTPTAVGSATGTLTLTDSDPSSPQSVSLNGAGIAGTPQAVLTPMTVPFGNQTVNTPSSGQVVVLSNPGTATLTNITVSITGTNPTDFNDNSSCSSTLAAGASCNISVIFNPTSIGAASAALSITDDATGSPQAATLTGSGTAAAAPQAVLSPSALSFPSTNVGVTSSAQTISLSNPGNATLTINGISLTGANAADFAETSTCGATLAASSSCTISVTFTPASAASFAAAVSVADSATGSPQTVTLSGTGTAVPLPQAVLTPSSLSFPSTTVGVTSTTQTLTLSNPGNATLSISGVTITGANTADFAETTTCSETLTPGATCAINVTFTPATVASFSAGVKVTDNAGGSPQVVTLSGTGIAATSADFTTSSTTPPQTVAAGVAAQYVISVQPSNGSFTGVVTLSATGLPPGATASFQPASVTPGSSGATSNMTIQTTAQLTSNAPPQRWPFLPPGIVAALVAPLFFRRRFNASKRRPAHRLLLGAFVFVLLGAGAVFMTGCGAGFALPSTSGSTTYTITVTGTSGSDTHSTTVSLILQ